MAKNKAQAGDSVTITPDDLAQLQSLVGDVVNDKGEVDHTTADSDAAYTTLLKAQADAADKDTVRTNAIGKLSLDLQKLRSFVDNLGGTPTPPPTPVPPPEPTPNPGT
jgi:hypothetical protein